MKNNTTTTTQAPNHYWRVIALPIEEGKDGFTLNIKIFPSFKLSSWIVKMHDDRGGRFEVESGFFETANATVEQERIIKGFIKKYGQKNQESYTDSLHLAKLRVKAKIKKNIDQAKIFISRMNARGQVENIHDGFIDKDKITHADVSKQIQLLTSF